jgi:DNA-binding transcriptional ArsR family regulator
MQDVLVIDKPEQLKALGHPLRVRVLQTLGEGDDEALTNRELAERLQIDPGHLHFHVRTLLRAGLIELADGVGEGREKPYRAVARVVRVGNQLLAAGAAGDIQSAMLDEVQRGFARYSPDGRYRSLQLTVRVRQEQAVELLTELAARAREVEDPAADAVVITAVVHPPAGGETL